MNWLSKTLPVYEHESNGYVRRFRWDEVEMDDNEGPMAEVGDEWVLVRHADDVPASWWTVAVYTSYPVYGGPEEGGWYYRAGSLTEHGRVRFFDDYAEALAYHDELWKWVDEMNNDPGWSREERLTVRSTTEALPDAHYPKNRPHYS